MNVWTAFFCILAALGVAGVIDSAARVVRWCYRKRKHLPEPVADDRDWQTKFYQEHST